MAHDLFAQQTIAGDIFFFRWILHNWADKYCIAVLRAQIPVLKPTSRIIIMEACLPDPGQTNVGVVPLWMEADSRLVILLAVANIMQAQFSWLLI